VLRCLPPATLSTVTAIRLARVSGFFASSIHFIHSARQLGERFFHTAEAPAEAASAAFTSDGAIDLAVVIATPVIGR
jgi:hypothetical protein